MLLSICRVARKEMCMYTGYFPNEKEDGGGGGVLK